jgi:hypothetical protein
LEGKVRVEVVYGREAIDFPSSHFTSKFTMDPQKQLQALSEEFQGLQSGMAIYLIDDSNNY